MEAQPVSIPVEPVNPLEQLKGALHLASTMPPSKIRKNLVGLVNLAPQIEDVLYEKIDLPLCTWPSTQKLKIPTRTCLSLRPSSTEMEIHIAPLIAILTILRLKADTLLRAFTVNLKNWEIFSSASISNFTTEEMQLAVFM